MKKEGKKKRNKSSSTDSNSSEEEKAGIFKANSEKSLLHKELITVHLGGMVMQYTTKRG